MRKSLVALSFVALAAVWSLAGLWGAGQSSSALLQSLDYGDAVYLESWDGYPTLLAHDGARHEIGGPWLGGSTDGPDAETDGQPEATALGDDNDGNDDENGVMIPTLYPGYPSDIVVEVSGGGGVVEGWIDYNHDYQWQHPTEQVFAGYLPDGVHALTVVTSTSATVGQTAARFRISTVGALMPTGAATDGEVEDHAVTIATPELDYGDAPDGVGAALYPTLLLHDGARHLARGPWLGDARDDPDVEADGQPDAGGLGDDNDAGGDDEDGVVFPTLVQGHPADLTVQVSGGGGQVDGWIDFDNDKAWQHPGECVVSGYYADGIHTVPITVPGDAEAGQTFARFRISNAGALAPDGPANYGEVEDYQVSISHKWEQLPDLDTTGMALTIASYDIPYRLADDFECRQPGYITGIDIWFAMYNDQSVSALTGFYLRLYSDLPDSLSPDGLEHPDTMIWSRWVNDAEADITLWAPDIREGWHRGDYHEFPADTSCWLARFSIPPEESFYQTGTPEEPQVYWLGIEAHTFSIYSEVGWKASGEHWRSGVVWPSGGNPDLTVRYYYPPTHAYAGQEIDMAFRIISDPGLQLDWGDAPDDPEFGAYPTLYVHDGARHIIGGPWLGDASGGPDPELDGQPHTQARGDDEADQDDEGGVQIPVLERGGPDTLTVEVNGGGGWVQGWIDFNDDQAWDNSEMVVAQLLPDGTHELVITVPAVAETGNTYARFRISSAGDLEPTGRGEDGEVEDYEVTIQDAGTGIDDHKLLPRRYGLHPPVPNPFNPSTTIGYDVPSPGGKVTIRIYDLAGRLVRTLVDGEQMPGTKRIVWYGLNDRNTRVASGVYFCRMTAPGFAMTKKMVLLQ